MKNNLPIWLEGYFDKIGQGSSHHAFLILGKKGLGKSLFAEYLACLLYTSPSPRDRG